LHRKGYRVKDGRVGRRIELHGLWRSRHRRGPHPASRSNGAEGGDSNQKQSILNHVIDLPYAYTDVAIIGRVAA
jgi:hypothetical protein